MSQVTLTQLLASIREGYVASKKFKSLQKEIVLSYAEAHNLPIKTTKAATRDTLAALVLRTQKDPYFNEDMLEDAIKEYTLDQALLRRFRKLQEVPPIEVIEEHLSTTIRYIYNACEIHAQLEKAYGHLPGDFASWDDLIDDAKRQVFNIFLYNIKKRQFRLYSTLRTYIDGIAKIVVKQLMRKPNTHHKKISHDIAFRWDLIVNATDLSRFFSFLYASLKNTKGEQCEDFLRDSFKLFNIIVANEPIHSQDLLHLKTSIIHKVGENLSYQNPKSSENKFRKCYRDFVAHHLEKLSKNSQWFQNPLFTKEYIKKEVAKRKAEIELARIQKKQSNDKRNLNGTK